jgi:HD-like signal output (HDOD) protein
MVVDVQGLLIKISRSENLPVLPQVATQVLHIVDSPSASHRDLAKVIEGDPAIAGKVLRVANSPMYGVQNITSIGRAISVLGLNTVRTLILGVVYQQIISGKQRSQRFSKIELWQHSLAVATCARVLAKLKLPLKAEELYCAGLMHDVGVLVLDRFSPDDLDRAISFAFERKTSLPTALREIIGADQGQIGAMLAEKWGLSPLISACIRGHLSPTEGEPNHQAACFINLADVVAHRCGYVNNSPAPEMEYNESSLTQIGLPLEQLEIIQGVVVAEVEKTRQALQIK